MTVIEMSSSTEVRKVTVLLQYLRLFNIRMEALAAKAEEFGVEPMRAVEVGRERGTFITERGVRYPVIYVDFEISGMTPRLPGGWKFLGSIEHAVNGAVLVHGDDERLLAFRDLPAYCEHCKTQRLRRKTIVVESAAGEVLRLGSSCMKDFLGLHGDPDRLLDMIEDFNGEMSEFSKISDREPSLVDFLSVVSATIRYFGAFVPKSAESNATADWVAAAFKPFSMLHHSEAAVVSAINESLCEADLDRAIAAIEWAQGIDADIANSYLSNLHQIADADVLLPKHHGLAASMISAYEREMVKLAVKAEEVEEVAGVVVAGRYVVEGTVLSTKWVENGYGESLKMLVRIEQADGIVRLWGSVPSAIDPEIGDKVRFTAAVETGREADFGFFKRPTKAEIVA